MKINSDRVHALQMQIGVSMFSPKTSTHISAPSVQSRVQTRRLGTDAFAAFELREAAVIPMGIIMYLMLTGMKASFRDLN